MHKTSPAHREAAYRAYYNVGPSKHNPDHVKWVADGVCFWSPTSQFCCVDRIADAMIAALEAIADTADIIDQGSPVLYVRVDSIESLGIELEAANG